MDIQVTNFQIVIRYTVLYMRILPLLQNLDIKENTIRFLFNRPLIVNSFKQIIIKKTDG
ncbi:hypothetical protein LEP1GSC019_4304 [Leptospira interrogans serovar Pyrogenes str. 2006006960]|nr:hypothetical protein LEP1GSC019_4304 [Leptospira interrogans serovar Pyrogenes str. 2006006960]